MEIKDMLMEDVEKRLSEIMKEKDAPEADLDALDAEIDALEARKKEIKERAEKRSEMLEKIAAIGGDPAMKEERDMTEKFGIESKEYRDAFMAALVGRETEEQRAILADNSAYGDGLSLPVGLDEDIWDQVTTAHPILADVTVIKSGMAIKVTKMTPAAVTKKMDSAASSEQTFTSAEVVLVGADYHTYVNLSYAEAKMSQGAMEKFLVKEIADALGEALAKDVFARILSDAGNTQKVTATTDMLDDVKGAMALATMAAKPVIYAPATSYYEIVAAVKQGVPFNIGHTVGCDVKLDNAATKVTIVDPTMFVLNVIQETMIESDRDVTNARFVIGGYMRAEGCLRKTKAAAYIN